MPIEREPIGYLRLGRSLSWQMRVNGKMWSFTRGAEPTPVYDEWTYDYLLRQGYVVDPYKQFNEITPEHLRTLRPGTEVVVIRNIGLGDIIMICGVLRLLIKRHPHLSFSFATTSHHRPLFNHIGWIRTVYQISSMRGMFPAILELRGFAERHPDKYRMERIDIYSRYLLAHEEPYYEFEVPTVTDVERDWAIEFLGNLPRPWVLFAIKSVTTHLRSLPEQQVHKVTSELMNRGVSVIHVNPHPIRWPCSLNLTGKLDVRQLAALTAVSDCVISPDTGLYHLAEAVQTPHVDLFSTWPPNRRVSKYRYAFPIWKGDEVACAPCWDHHGACTALRCFRAMGVMEIADRVEEAIASQVVTDVEPAAIGG